MHIAEKIKILAKDHFDDCMIEEFISTFKSILDESTILGSILQISTDHGVELELGFFTKKLIADVTLSSGKVYSCFYPLFNVASLNISELENKSVLTIQGDKKFDYNIVKPGSTVPILNYEAVLRQHLQLDSVHRHSENVILNERP